MLTYAALAHINRKVFDSNEYEAVRAFYEDRCAERSRVPLINHIHEGLVVMHQINASEEAQRAYCLHPLFQADKDLASVGMPYLADRGWQTPGSVVALTMEYRYRANAWLSDKVKWIDYDRYNFQIETGGTSPNGGDLEEVVHMLIADKVQNRKDFLTHHKDTHPRRHELDYYFTAWLRALSVDDAEYQKLCAAIDAMKKDGS